MIKAVMFDMGGTLEDIHSEEKNNHDTAVELYRILTEHGITVQYEADELWSIVGPRIDEYKEESVKTLRELKPEEIWVNYAFKGIDCDKEKLAACSEEIAAMWEVTFYDRKLREHVPEMLKGLKELGLYVSVVSNTSSLFQVFDILEKYGIRDYFDDITLSSVTGYRKPHPYIFEVALRQGKLKPEECAYVGDTVSRDIVGPKKAGYGETFQIISALTPFKDTGKYDVKPDHVVSDMLDVYNILKEELGK